MLVLDEGTTGTKAFVVDENVRIVSTSYQEIALITDEEGHAELDGEEIFNKSVEVCKDAIAKAGITPGDIACMAIDYQRSSLLAWDKAGRPYGNCISWQDSRITYLTQRAQRDHMVDYIRDHLGRSKVSCGVNLICWMAEHYPGFREKLFSGALMYGAIDSWLLYRFTGGKRYAASVDSATLNGIIDVSTHEVTKDYLAWLNLPSTGLPEILENKAHFGVTEKSIFGVEIPISAVIADQHAAVYAQRVFQEGDMKCTLGTGAFIDVNTGSRAVPPKSAYSTLLAWVMDGKPTYIGECYVAAVGTFQRWLKSVFQLESYGEISALADSVKSSGGVYVVPTILGMVHPEPDVDLKAVFAGVSASTGRPQLMRASLEGLAFLCKKVMTAMIDDMGVPFHSLRVDGGMARSSVFCQMLSNALGVDVVRPGEVELTAIGAAEIGGISAGLWDENFVNRAQKTQAFVPTDEAECYLKKYARWEALVRQAKIWTHL